MLMNLYFSMDAGFTDKEKGAEIADSLICCENLMTFGKGKWYPKYR